MTPWPEIVWSGPALCDLDARARAEIAAAGSVVRLAKAQAVFRAGEPADVLFAVVDGHVALHAEGCVLRRAGPGDTFGEEPLVIPSAARIADATAEGPARVVALPAGLVARALERGGGGRAERVQRALRRRAAHERLRASPVARHVDEAVIAAWLDAATDLRLARGEVLFRAGDRARHTYFVAAGMIELRAGGGGTALVRAGAIVGDTRGASARAAGPSWVLAIPVEHTRGLRSESPVLPVPAGARPLRDPWRFDVARSLPVIDQAACVRCGHCAWSCAQAHDDGLARIARRGEVIAAHVEGGGFRALLVATACQHCAIPACVPACPTGALRHEASGDVALRSDLCTGCGACAKACPWDAVRMAPRAGGGDVAVKCDLCRGTDRASPACVTACPTEAIARIDPRLTLAPARVEALPVVPVPPRTPAWPFVALGAAASLLLARASLSVWISGAIAGGTVGGAFAYGAWKRLSRRGGRGAYLVHLALAPLASVAVLKHAGRVAPNAGGALLVAAGVAIVSGAALAVAYVVVPPRLARVERAGALPEDLAPRAEALEARAFAALTGQSEATKRAVAEVLLPYARSWTGAMTFASGTRESTRLLAALRARDPSAAGLEALAEIAVEMRRARAQLVLQRALRGLVAPHVIASCVAVALLAVHVAIALVYR